MLLKPTPFEVNPLSVKSKKHQDFNRYLSFHIWIHEAGYFHLFKDSSDKYEFIKILAKTCEDESSSLFAFNVLNTHYHYLFGLKFASRNNPDPSWLDEQVKKFVYLVNRRYGIYYRKKYNFSGELFKKYNISYKYAPFPKDFVVMLKYVHLNSIKAKIYPTLENDPFNSYSYYLAAFIQNPEVQILKPVQYAAHSTDALQIYNSLDLLYPIKQYSGDFKIGVKRFLNEHLKSQMYFSPHCAQGLQNLSINELLNNPDFLDIKKTQGHKVKRFIEALDGVRNQIIVPNSFANINGFELAEENSLDSQEFKKHFDSFAAFFPWYKEYSIKECYAFIRKNHFSDYINFLKAMSKKVSLNCICKTTGINIYSLKKLFTE